jgi:hypothetical protein
MQVLRTTMKLIPVALLLAGCQTTAQQQQGPQQPVWARADGRMIRGNAALEQQWQMDTTYCKAEAYKAGLSAGPIYWQGIAGAIAADIAENNRSKAMVEIAKGCMAGKGYIQISMEEAEARRLRQAGRRR